MKKEWLDAIEISPFMKGYYDGLAAALGEESAALCKKCDVEMLTAMGIAVKTSDSSLRPLSDIINELQCLVLSNSMSRRLWNSNEIRGVVRRKRGEGQ